MATKRTKKGNSSQPQQPKTAAGGGAADGTGHHSILYPPHERPVGFLWITPDGYDPIDPHNSQWVSIGVSFHKKPSPNMVAAWLRQLLSTELGEKLADDTLSLLARPDINSGTQDYEILLSNIRTHLMKRKKNIG